MPLFDVLFCLNLIIIMTAVPCETGSRTDLLSDEDLDGKSLITSRGQAVFGVSGHLVDCESLSGREFRVSRSKLVPYPSQPRQYFPEKDVEEFGEKLKSEGQLMPIVVAPYVNESGALCFMIVDGEMRFRAMKTAGIEEALIVVHSYNCEADLYKAAASTHKDSTTLGKVDRLLMLAHLYDLASSERGGVSVVDFAREIGVGYNDIHYGLRMRKMPPKIVELGVRRIIIASAMVYLMNRFQEYGDGFPGDILVSLLEDVIRKKGDGSISKKEIEELFQKALIKSKRADEALTLQTRHSLEVFLRSIAVSGRTAQDLLEEAEDEDPAIVELLSDMTPRSLAKTRRIVDGLRDNLDSFSRLLAVASGSNDLEGNEE